MLLSTYTKRDTRTTHEKWCDSMINKAQNQRVRSVKTNRAPTNRGASRYNYSNLELKILFENCLTK